MSLGELRKLLNSLVMKKKQITVTQRFFHRLPRHRILNSPHTSAWALKTAIPYFEIKVTATRTAQKKKQYGNTANPYVPLLFRSVSLSEPYYQLPSFILCS